jgi:HD-GYP domain-containing protein (c-di-GMP phosphodiesterase class II)
VQAFQSLAQREAFWLDCTSKRIYALVVDMVEMTPIDATNQTIRGIAEIFARLVDAMSRWTATHSAGVAATAVALSEHLNLSMREQIQMRTAGLLHDLGKLSVPPEILDHPGKIPEKQWASVKAHPYYTYRILETTGFPRPIVEWASFHHERLDGTGYPFHLNDQQLTLGSRIMAVADIFTALTEVRPYRKGLSKDDAIAALKQMVRAGGIDAKVVNTLVEHFDSVDDARRQEQARYAERQKALSEIMTGAEV